MPLLIGTAAVVFLANAGLLVLQLAAGRYLAPFIGSSVETWTSVIGVFLTGIALGNWIGGRIADRFPSPKTVGVLLLLGGISSLGMIGCYEYTLSSGFYKSLPLGPRIPILAFIFCLLPAFSLSLLTPVTIKLLLPDVGSAGRIAGLIFAISTLGCLIGNYLTGFWLMAFLTLNEMTMGVGGGLIALAVPAFFFRRAKSASEGADTDANAIPEAPDGGWDFRNNLPLAKAIVFFSSFCGMSLELAGVRVLAPILGVSLYTWTGIIGVMLAGTASGNYLGGILADRGIGPAVRRFALLIAILIGAASAPVIARELFPTFNADQIEWIELLSRLIGAILGGLLVVTGLWLAKRRSGGLAITAVVGGLIGTVVAHTAGRAIDKVFKFQAFTDFHENLARQLGFDIGPWLIHGLGLLVGVIIAVLFARDAPRKVEFVTRSGALSGTFFLAAMLTLAILLLSGIYIQYVFMMNARDVVQKVLGWTFGLFFLPMLLLGTISPQVIRLSVSDVKHAGRVAGSIYAWSTTGAIIGTFATGYFLISSLGTFRVLIVLSFVLILIAFFVGRLWKNNAMLYATCIIAGAAIFGLFAIDHGSNRYDRETKYYAIKVINSEIEGKRRVKLVLDHLTHSIVDLDDPTWLGYPHEYVQGELLQAARLGNKDTRLLVIGGGGYTFPRSAEFAMPDVQIDVVEIDPGVTDIAFEKLALRRDTAIRSHHMDGRQYVSERAGKGQYRLVMQDAVNDLSVPYHLMTKEYNDAVKQTLTPDGAYLLTLIDSIRDGKLWRAAVHTMRQTFKYVYLVSPDSFHLHGAIRADRQVYIVYGSDQPLDVSAVQLAQQKDIRQIADGVDPAAPMVPVQDKTRPPLWKETYIKVLDNATLDQLVNQGKKIMLTDQYCPVDNLMAEVFRDRERDQR